MPPADSYDAQVMVLAEINGVGTVYQVTYDTGAMQYEARALSGPVNERLAVTSNYPNALRAVLRAVIADATAEGEALGERELL